MTGKDGSPLGPPIFQVVRNTLFAAWGDDGSTDGFFIPEVPEALSFAASA
jgi:hypothetical protein